MLKFKYWFEIQCWPLGQVLLLRLALISSSILRVKRPPVVGAKGDETINGLINTCVTTIMIMWIVIDWENSCGYIITCITN